MGASILIFSERQRGERLGKEKKEGEEKRRRGPLQSRLRGLPPEARSRACKLDFSEALRPSRTSWIRAQNQVFFKFLVTHRLDKLSLAPFFKLSSSRQAAPPHKTKATARSAELDVQILWVIKWRVCDRSTSNRNTHRDCDKIGSIGAFSHFPR